MFVDPTAADATAPLAARVFDNKNFTDDITASTASPGIQQICVPNSADDFLTPSPTNLLTPSGP